MALALLAALMGPAYASATSFDPAHQGEAQWLDVGDLWARFQKWLAALPGSRGQDTEKRGSDIDPNGGEEGES